MHCTVIICALKPWTGKWQNLFLHWDSKIEKWSWWGQRPRARGNFVSPLPPIYKAHILVAVGANWKTFLPLSRFSISILPIAPTSAERPSKGNWRRGRGEKNTRFWYRAYNAQCGRDPPGRKERDRGKRILSSIFFSFLSRVGVKKGSLNWWDFHREAFKRRRRVWRRNSPCRCADCKGTDPLQRLILFFPEKTLAIFSPFNKARNNGDCS